MLHYTLLIYQAPQRGELAYTAYCFAQAAIARGHQISQVFFYGDAAYLAQNTENAPSDERNHHSLWQALATQHHIPLVYCHTAAEWRGVQAALPFQAGGLGQFIESSLHADRVITFGLTL